MECAAPPQQPQKWGTVALKHPVDGKWVSIKEVCKGEEVQILENFAQSVNVSFFLDSSVEQP